jgi:hypothetical protein
MVPTESVRTDNYFTPLYTETQETDHTTVNANLPPPIHEDTRDAYVTAAEAAATTNVDDTEAEAVPADVADFIARLTAEASAAEVAEVAEAAATEAAANAAARQAAEEASATEAADNAKNEAEAAEAAAEAQEEAATIEAEKKRQKALEVAAAAVAAKATAEKAAAAAKAKRKQTQETQKDKAAGGSTSGTHTIAQQALNNDLPPDLDEWELSEGGLPEVSTLSGNKALLDDYPEDEANSKKHKKTNTGKGKKGKSTPKA